VKSFDTIYLYLERERDYLAFYLYICKCASRISSDEVVTKIMTSIKLIRWLKAPLHLRTFMVKYLLSALLYMSISVGSEQMWKET